MTRAAAWPLQNRGMTDHALAVDGDLVIRRMRDANDDYELIVTWRNRPHVRHWWDPDLPDLTLDSAKTEYEDDIRDDSATTLCIAELDGRPIGFMQFYRWASYADEAREVGIPFDDDVWGVDVFIGEQDETGRGLGTRMMNVLCRYLEVERSATSVALTTELTNAAAIRCYEKAGFEKIREVTDLDTRDGRRTRDWLMIRTAE